jgi:hypothetical protein
MALLSVLLANLQEIAALPLHYKFVTWNITNYMERNRQEIIQQVISKAWEDARFREELVADPVNVIERLTGSKIVLPEGKTLVIADQTDKSKIYVSIPSEPEMENMELTEDQLESIAGGKSAIWDTLVDTIFSSTNVIKFSTN